MNLRTELPNYGINSRGSTVRWFHGNATPDALDYLDLVEPSGTKQPDEVMPDGVAENQGRPLLFFINANQLARSPDKQNGQLKTLRRTLGCRGDRAYLAVIRPGTLDVTPVSLANRTPEWQTYKRGSNKALTFFSRLSLGRCDELEEGEDNEFLFNQMFKLVDRTATRLEQLRVKRADVLSLVGRALFFRFLRDREVIKEDNVSKIAPRANRLVECFDNAENATATCQWLDKTFNGDFLPLTDEGSRVFFDDLGRRIGGRIFHHLRGIARGQEPVGDDGFQLRLPIHWGDLEFDHIPVGLLSQVYERLSWKWEPEDSRKSSVHYTPRNIAATLVDEAFDNLPNAHRARVLDPACGASVFLVFAFRRLYRERWKASGKRPDTAAIREILEEQLTGFDINESALKLSALSLYLTAIELDPEPVPPEKLAFRKVRSGRSAILFNWRRDDDRPVGPVIGSLGAHVGARFDGAFDLVLSNPPWTSLEKKHKAVALELDKVSRNIVTRKDVTLGKLYENPDSGPDLPFLWKATEWCKPDTGRIAMALPARTLFKQRDNSRHARKAIFRLLEITGIINCSNLRKTNVWPDMDQPFMLLFARNRKPRRNHRIHFISPQTDLPLNRAGEMRIDDKSAAPVEVEAAINEPWLWKALAVGTPLDIEVVRKIKASGGRPLEEYWVKDLKLACSNGYQIKATQTEQQDATLLKRLPNLNSPSQFRFAVDVSCLEKFKRATAFRTRLRNRESDKLRVYRSPLALIKESPGPNRLDGWAWLSLDDVAYNQSFYGYSGAGRVDGKLLTRYLQLFVHSQLWLHHALLTSAKLGFERPNIYKEDLDECLFVPLEHLTDLQREQVCSLSKRLIREDSSVFADIDTFFGELYGLDEFDVEVIRDTLEVREPNDELGVRASTPPTTPERAKFMRRIESILRPFFKVLNKQPELAPWSPDSTPDTPFVVMLLRARGTRVKIPATVLHEAILPLANETGAVRIIKQLDGALLIGVIRQYRYWTPSRARMLAATILREHLTVLEG
jgi:N-6 DNA Methylase